MDENGRSAWTPFDGGSTIGGRGSEDGTIVADDEHPDGARITLESNCGSAPFAITCGIYGWFYHTTYVSQQTCLRRFLSMRDELARILSRLPHDDRQEDREATYAEITAFVERYP